MKGALQGALFLCLVRLRQALASLGVGTSGNSLSALLGLLAFIRSSASSRARKTSSLYMWFICLRSAPAMSLTRRCSAMGRRKAVVYSLATYLARFGFVAMLAPVGGRYIFRLTRCRCQRILGLWPRPSSLLLCFALLCGASWGAFGFV